jgi:hypothetical protein
MEIVEIPLVALQTSLKYWRDEQSRYAEMGEMFIEMRDWCKIRGDVYESILEMYAK